MRAKPILRTRAIAVRSGYMMRHPRNSYIVNPMLSLDVATPEIYQFTDAVIHMQENPPLKLFLVGCSSPFLRVTKQLTAIRAWCKQCLPGQRKPDVLCPGNVGMRGPMIIRLRPCMLMNTPPHPSSARTHAPIAVSGSGHTRKHIISFDPILFMQESPLQKAVFGRMQPTGHTTRRTPALRTRRKKSLTGL